MLLKRLLPLFGQVIGVALILYLLFSILTSTLPYISQPKVSQQNRRYLERMEFEGKGVGPDKAMLIENTTEAFGVRLRLLQEASKTLDVVYHTIDQGVTTDAFLGQIWQAAERGVTVRILLDGKTGTYGARVTNMLESLACHPNIEYRIYNPVRTWHPWDWHALLHDKFILVDGRLLLLGGRNLGDKCFDPASYQGDVTEDRDVLVWHAGEPGGDGAASVMPQIEDYMALLWEHPDAKPLDLGKNAAADMPLVQDCVAAIDRLQESDPAYFDLTLQGYLDSTLPTNKVTLLHNPLDTGCSEPWIGYTLSTMAQNARHSVVVQSPYATAHPLLLDALGNTAQGVDVSLVTNSMASAPNFPAFSNYITQRQKFIDTGVNIYEYQNENSLHGKSVLIDGHLSAVGSLNLDDRSLYIDTETMLVIDSEPFAQSLGQAMEAYKSEALLVGSDNQYVDDPGVEAVPVPLFKKALMYIVSLFSRPLRFLI